MMFLPKIYEPRDIAEMICDGVKTQTRRLVKEGKIGIFNIHDGKFRVESNGRIKWQVGRDYAVQLGRGKPGLWYCPKCKNTEVCYYWNSKRLCRACYTKMKIWNNRRVKHFTMKPLRNKITSIRKERLLDISEEDAKKEGFKDKYDFLRAFLKANNMYEEGMKVPNPEVWVLDFEVKK